MRLLLPVQPRPRNAGSRQPNSALPARADLIKRNRRSKQLPAPASSNTFERIKRVNRSGVEFWSARELARTLEYSEFRHFLPVIEKAREACLNSAHRIEDHFEDWRLSRYACY